MPSTAAEEAEGAAEEADEEAAGAVVLDVVGAMATSSGAGSITARAFGASKWDISLLSALSPTRTSQTGRPASRERATVPA